MENSEFRHLAPLPSQYLRMPANNPGSAMLPGVPGSSLEQLVSANIARLREQIERDTRKQWNPVWESMINKAPGQMRGALKQIMSSGVGSDASFKFMQDPNIQAALGTSGIADSIATQRMLSHSGSFGGMMGPMNATGRIMQFAPPTNPGDLIAHNAMRLQGTAQYQSALYNRLYRDDAGKVVLPGGNRQFTGGMSAADAINLGSYAAQYGGPMSRMAVGTRPEVEAFNRMKVEQHGVMARTMSEFMKTVGATDLNEGLDKFRQLEGAEFGTVNPISYARKLKSIGRIAAKSNLAAADVLNMNSYAEGMIGAGTGMGAGSRYDYGRRADQGMALRATENAAGVAYSKGITDPGETAKIGALHARRQAELMNTTGGRAIDLIEKLHWAGRLTDNQTSEYMRTAASGGNMSPMLKEITAQTGVDIRKTMMNDSAYRETRYGLTEEGKAGRAAKGMSEPAIGVAQMTSERYAYDNQQFKYRADGRRIYAEASARGASTMVRAMERENGMTYSDEQKKTMGKAAMDDMVAKVNADPEMSVETKKDITNRIKTAKDDGMSLSDLQNSLRRLGGAGSVAASLGERAYLEQRRNAVKGTESYKNNQVTGATRTLGADLLSDWNLGEAKGETQEAQDADMRKKFQAVVNDPKTSVSKREQAEAQLKKMEVRARTPEEMAAEDVSFEKAVDEQYKTSRTSQTSAERKASERAETSKGSSSVDVKANKDKDNQVTAAPKSITVTGSVSIENNKIVLLDVKTTEGVA